MKKIQKKGLSLVILVMALGVLLNLNPVLAVSGVNMKITGVVSDYSSDVWLRTDSNAGVGNSFDVYDMPAPDSPSDYSKFSSTITGGTAVSIDSWQPDDRIIQLIYEVPAGDGGDVQFSWDSISGTGYEATFTITGGVTRNMRTTSSDTYAAEGGEDIYVIITVSDYSAPEEDDSDSGSGGGGGGTSTPVEQAPINIILNLSSNKLLFDAALTITDSFKNIQQGQNMRSTMNLIPMGQDPDLDVYLRYYIIDKSSGKEVEVGDGESETIKITGEKTFDKTFYTQGLEPGEYELWLELKYESEPGKFLFAEASSQFMVSGLESQASAFSQVSKYKLLVIIFGGAIFVLILLIVIIMSRTRLRRPKHK